MMLEAVTFDIDGAMSPTFAVPDASGLAPLVLPDGFAKGRDPSQQQPSFDAVMRFEASMGGGGDASIDGARAAYEAGVKVLAFPELALASATAGDLCRSACLLAP